uniref:VWFA domain-containing protein n=1 Tax=Denticeps clupeoides TaxID=299321 RepID=A0AAY4ACX3_9TELE
NEDPCVWPALLCVIYIHIFSSTESQCKGKPLDFVFVIDSSRSVRPDDYEKVKAFIANVVSFLDVGQNATRVGLLQYGSIVQNEFSLQTFHKKADVLQAISSMVHLASGTMTGLALRYTTEEAFSEAQGARPAHVQVPRVAMVVTDGRPQDTVEEAAAEARQAGIQIFAVGVGRVDMSTLRAIGSEPHSEHVFLVANFSQIETLSSVFQDKLCLDICQTVDHGCEHQCVSKPGLGSYLCICSEGYTLGEDGKSCKKPFCKNGAMDLVFVIDGSKSLGAANFERVKRWVNGIVDSLVVSRQGTQVGLIQYSTKVRTEFTLAQHTTAKSIQEAVSRMHYMGRGSMTGSALRHMFEHSFSAKEGSRAGISRVSIVFTDGRSQDDVSIWATKAKDAGVTIYAVGVGKAIEDELREIASEPDDKHLYYTEDLSRMSDITDKLKAEICQGTSFHQIIVSAEMSPGNQCECDTLIAFQNQATEQIRTLTRKHILSG